MAGLMSMDIASLERLMEEFHEPRFRAKQIFSWLARGRFAQSSRSFLSAVRNDTKNSSARRMARSNTSLSLRMEILWKGC